MKRSDLTHPDGGLHEHRTYEVLNTAAFVILVLLLGLIAWMALDSSHVVDGEIPWDLMP